MSDVTLLLEKARSGDKSAWDQAVALVYHELKHIARGVLGSPKGSLNVTSLVHECYLRLEHKGAARVQNREHLLAVSATAMRQLMLNHARDRMTQKRGEGARHTMLSALDQAAVDEEAEQLLALDDAMQALAKTDPTAVRASECRMFAGMTDEQTALALAVPLRSLQRKLADAKSALAKLLTA